MQNKPNRAETKTDLPLTLKFPEPDGDPMLLDDPDPLFTLDEIAEATKGEWISGYDRDVVITGVCYRKTEIRPGDLFVPRYAKQWGRSSITNPTGRSLKRAVSKGAAAIIIHEVLDDLPGNVPVLLVKNTRKGLHNLARFSRKRFGGKIIAITGSAGKTSTKEMIRFLLAQNKPTVGSRGNFNHDVGVALSLSQTQPSMSYGVYEFGVDSPHLTLMKAKMLKPHVAIVTEIYEAHLSHYKTMDKLVEQKSLLFDGVAEGGIVILNHDSEFFETFRNNALEKGIQNIMTYGRHDGSDIRLKKYQLHLNESDVEVEIDGRIYRYKLSIPGYHNIQNSLAALAAVKMLGEDLEAAANDIGRFQSIKDRTQYYELSYPGCSFTLIDDVFNANPGSINAGLQLLSLMAADKANRMVVVLSQMKKPGEESARLHSELSRPLVELGIDKVYTLGAEMEHLRNALPDKMRGSHGTTYEDIIDDLIADIKDKDIIFLKGPDPSPEKTKKIVPRLQALQRNDFSCIFVGDTSFGESYQERYKREGEGNILELKGYDYPLLQMRDMLSSADLVIANLETPLTDLKTSPFKKIKSWLHRSDIKQSPEAFLRHNITVMALANNHSFDYGLGGFQQTLKVLNKYKINCFGGGNTLREARKPYIKEVEVNKQSFRFAVFSSFKVLKNQRDVFGVYAEKDKPGISPLRVNALRRQISRIKKDRPDTYIISFPHWGSNYAWMRGNQQRLAHGMIDAGVDLVIGHGSHMIQEIEQYKNKWIVYSLGNFMFNSRGRYKRYDAPPYSFAAKFLVREAQTGLQLNLKLYPIFTNNRLTRFQPRFVDGREFVEVNDVLKDKGSPLSNDHFSAERCGDQAVFYIDLDIGTI